MGPSNAARIKEPQERAGDGVSVSGRVPRHIMEMVARWKQDNKKGTGPLLTMALFEFLTRQGYHNPAKINNYNVRGPQDAGIVDKV